jgi:RHS repeat-associated protein
LVAADGSAITPLNYSPTGRFLTGGYAYADFDQDNDVDGADYILFQACMSGSGNKPPLSCTPGGPPPAGNFGLHGRPIDVFTDPDGNRHALLFVRARHYDLTNGRWLQRDPMGYVDGPNLYEAFGGNPLSHVDPDGTRYKLASGWANGDEVVWQDYGYFTGVTADFSVGRYYCLGGEKFVTYSSPFIDDPNPNVDFYVLPLAIVEQWGQGQLSQGLYNHWVRLFGIPYHRDDDGNAQRIERDPWEAGVTVIGQLTEQNRMAIRRIYNWCTTGPGDRVLTMVTRGADPVAGQNVTEKDAKEVVANITWYVAQAWLAGRLVGPGGIGGSAVALDGEQAAAQAMGTMSRGASLRAKYGPLAGTVDQRINLRAVVAAERDSLRLSLTGRERGPMIGGVMDTLTDGVFTGRNTESIGAIHPALAQRMVGVARPHGEIVALNKALWARGADARIDDSFILFNLRFSRNLSPSMPRCPTCVGISEGVFSLSDVGKK